MGEDTGLAAIMVAFLVLGMVGLGVTGWAVLAGQVEVSLGIFTVAVIGGCMTTVGGLLVSGLRRLYG
jgi:hypothetical protein